MMINAASGSMTLLITTLLILALNYAFNFGLGWILAPKEYGIYGVTLAIFEISAFFVTRGLANSVVKLLAEEGVSQEKNPVIFKTALLGNFLVALVLAGLLYVLCYRLLTLDSVYLRLVPLIMVLVFIISGRAICFNTLAGLFRFKERGIGELSESVVKLVVGLELVYLGYGAAGAFAGFLAGAVFSLGLSAFFLRDFKFWRNSRGTEWRVVSLGIPMLVTALAILTMQNSDILAIKLLGDRQIANELAGFYQAALVIGRFPFYLTGATMVALFPFFSRFERQGVTSYATLALKYTTIFILPISIVTAVKANHIILLLFPKAYLNGATALALIGVSTGLLCLCTVLTSVFQATGRPALPALVLSGSAVLQVGLLAAMIPRFSIGGAAISAAIAALAGLLSLTYAYSKIFNFRLKMESTQGTLASLAVLAIVTYFMPTSGRLVTLLGLAVASFAYGLSLFLLKVLTDKDIDILLSGLPNNRYSKWLSLLAKRIAIKLNKIASRKCPPNDYTKY